MVYQKLKHTLKLRQNWRVFKIRFEIAYGGVAVMLPYFGTAR
jgi:hypothetical protein